MAERQNIDERVIYETDGAIARLILDWPQKANAQDSRMVWAMDKALKLAHRDYDVKVLIIKANGKGFCSGHAMGDTSVDFPEFTEDLERTGTHWKSSADLFLWPVLALMDFPKPVIAQVHGYAIGAGSYWALIPDITICTPDAFFQMPLPQALGFPTGETMIEPWVFMNAKRAAEYLFQSKTLDAKTALEWGAVNQVVPAEALEETVEAIARNIARAPLTTLMMTKTLIRRAWDLMGMRDHMKMSTDLLDLATQSKDVREHLTRMRQRGHKPRETLDPLE
ncbi:MAG: menB 3 [Phenylobacterium sp.]|nr:menB 3 [Phenylobacterium sp.]